MLCKVGIFIKLTFIVCSYCLCFCNCRKLFAGPYDVLFKSMYLCDDVGENSVTFSTKLSKINRTHLSYTSNVTFPHGLHNSFIAKAEVSVFGNGGWQKNFMNLHLDKPCIDVKRLLPGVMEALCQSADVDCSICPIPPGTYRVKNWIFHLKLFAKTFPYNKYKAQFTWIEEGKVQTCFNLELDVVPKTQVKG